MTIGFAKFKNGVAANFMAPKRKTNKVIIICGGLPSTHGKDEIMEAFAKKGYHAISLRYKGTWESDGKFMDHAPHKDVLDLIPLLPKGFTDIWSQKKFKVNPKKIVVWGGSFGGMIALLCAQDKRVTKSVAFCPVVDWDWETKQEPLAWFHKFMRQYYSNVYRFSDNDWHKAKVRDWFNPMNIIDQIPKDKVMMIYAKDDPSVPSASMDLFSRKLGCKTIKLNKGGHVSTILYLKNPRLKREINQFLS